MSVLSSPSLRNGAWLLNNGDALFLDEAESSTPNVLPEKGAAQLIKFLSNGGDAAQEVCDIASVRKWICMNPPPSGAGEDATLAWLGQVMQILILAGATLIWRGEIFTIVRSGAQLSATMQKRSRHVERLAWPESHIVDLHVLTPGESMMTKPI